jgi:hypothetical protein
MNNLQLCPNDFFKRFIEFYQNKLVDLAGIILNGLCIIVFSRILINTQQSNNNNNMFKYLLMKSIMDFIEFSSNIYRFLYECSNKCDSSKSYFFQIWVIWFYLYIEYITEILSVIFEIAATFDCYITIINKYEFCRSNSFFYYFSVTITIFWTLFYMIYPFGRVIKDEIDPFNNNESKHSYSVGYNDYGNSKFYSIIPIFDSIIRDGFLFIILVIINVKILIFLKKMTRQRQVLTGTNKSSNLLRNIQKTKRKKMQLIIAIGVNYSIGHFAFLMQNLLTYFNKFYGRCYHIYFMFPYFISYVDGIFFYCYFNNIFKKFLLGLIPFTNTNNQIEHNDL